jgi:hypothetical protein
MTKRIKQVRASKVREFILMNPDTPAQEVADKFGASLQTVYNLRYYLKKKLAQKGQVLKKSVRPAKLTTEQIRRKHVDKLLEEWTNKPKTVVAEPLPITFVEPDPVNHPAHYTHGGIETIDFIQAKLTPEEFRGYLKGNILKYGSRIGHKDNDMQDAGKLAWYTNKLRTVLGTK